MATLESINGSFQMQINMGIIDGGVCAEIKFSDYQGRIYQFWKNTEGVWYDPDSRVILRTDQIVRTLQNAMSSEFRIYFELSNDNIKLIGRDIQRIFNLNFINESIIAIECRYSDQRLRLNKDGSIDDLGLLVQRDYGIHPDVIKSVALIVTKDYFMGG